MAYASLVSGKVANSYKLPDGNIGIIVEQLSDGRRYAIEFETNKEKSCLENLYGLLDTNYIAPAVTLDNLVRPGHYVTLTAENTPSPTKKAYRLLSVGSRPHFYRPDPRYGRALFGYRN